MADVCVVGAGAAGITLAVELARQGRTVTLLEAGGATLEETAQESYAGELGGLPHRGLRGGRFRALGGTTTRWGGQILKLQGIDFARRPWVEGSGWPITRRELDPFYARALELEGVDGALGHDVEVWTKLGMRTPSFGSLSSYLSRWCPEANFAVRHGKTLESSERIAVWLHANAVELLLEGDSVVGVRCRTAAGDEAIFRGQDYVFALGAIESSRFFLQARAGDLPWNRSGLLGCHFQDHLDVDAATLTPKAGNGFRNVFDTIFLNGYKYTPKLTITEWAQRREGMLNIGATVYVPDEDETASALKSTAKKVLSGRLRQIGLAEARRVLRHSPALLAQSWRYAVQHRAYHPRSAAFRLRVHCEQEPLSASRISLSAERDAVGLLRTRLDWRISHAELETIRRFVQLARTALARVAEVTPHPALARQDSAFRNHCEDSFHHMGGMRMHADPGKGVVTPELKLHGTRNCFICSSAVFPTSGYSNPTHTLLALAVRLADHLVCTQTTPLYCTEQCAAKAAEPTLENMFARPGATR